MDVVGPVVDVISRVWNYMQEIQYEEKLDELRTLMEQLKEHRASVLSRVEAAEAGPLKRTPTVDEWLKNFDDLERDVTDVSQEGTRLLQISCISFWCPWNCWTNQKFGKKVMDRISWVKDLRDRGDFQVVAERPAIIPVQEMPEDPNTVGMDEAFATACRFLQQDSVKILGIYGLGGVGKTTLLKKINNKFLAASSSGFDFVIWAVVSKEASLERVQIDIGDRLGFCRQIGILSWPDSVGMRSRAQDIFNMLRSKKFLLLLDDIWERLELTDIGIPPPTSENKSKIIFTTRSYDVCCLMEANEKIPVKCLNAREAWELFQSKVGVICSDPEIQPLAEAVAEECGGLPLALTVIGKTMASKESVREWKNAITMLRKHAQDFRGMDRVYSVLKFSYDSLPNGLADYRSCFFFCSIYPEDYDILIERVVGEWIGQGYIPIDEFDEWEEAVNMGHDVIGVLKAFCLLESGVRDDTRVKMHDVIRDMAHWIACECGREILVIGDDGISVTRRTEKLKSAQMISISNPDAGFNSLGERPDCPNVTTLLYCGYAMSISVPLHDDLFLLMPALRFLSLGVVKVANVPTSIGKLVCLEYLSLHFGDNQVILPGEMKNLTRLRYLYLCGKCGSCRMPVGVIGHLSNLQVLHSGAIRFGEDMGADIQELGCLNRLILLKHITISEAEVLEFFFSHRRLLDYTIGLEIDETFGTGDRKIIKCPPSSSSSSCLSLGSMKRLKDLWIYDCLDMEELVLSCSLDEKETDLCQSLERIDLHNLPKCKSIVYCDVPNLHRLCFGSLKEVSISRCHSMLNVTWLLAAPKLESLLIINCKGVEEILCEGFGAIEETTFSNLEKLELGNLPNLRVICANVLPFPSLEEIIVRSCPGLRRLPLKPNNNLGTIRGPQKWWDNLEWESDTTKYSFAQFYKPYRHY